MHAHRALPLFLLAVLLCSPAAAAAESGATPNCPQNQVCLFYGAKLEKTSGQKTFPTTGITCPAAAVITVPFSHARSENGQIRPHLGIDLGAEAGTDVKAAAGGKVLQTPTDYSNLGTAIILRHSENPKVDTVYGHLQSARVRPGDVVKKGDVIGRSGSSGQGTGKPSLYFELDREGNPSPDVQDICSNAYVDPKGPPGTKGPHTPSGAYDVRSRAQFQTGQIQLAGITDCVKQTESACPQIGTAAYKGRTWRTANTVCIYRATSGIYRVPYSLLKADMVQESGGRQFAESAYAQGYAQLVPETAAGMGIGQDKVFDPYYNICGGVEYFARQLKAFGSVECALAAYNAGPYEKTGTVQSRNAQACANHPYSETRNYVKSISAAWDKAMAAG